jgi:hypothetical protein
MELKIKDKLPIKSRFGAMKKIETIHKMMLKILNVKHRFEMNNLEAMPYDFIPKSRRDMLEFERKQAQAMADIQRMRLRMV